MPSHMLTDRTEIANQIPGRICFLVRGLDGGGAQRDAILLANELQRRGRPSAIATLEAKGHLRDLIDPQVPVVDLGRGRKLRLAFAFGAIRRLLTQGRPAALISSEAAGNVLAVLASRGLEPQTRPRIILREVASPVQARHNDPYWQNRLAYRLVGRLYPQADLVITFTAGACDDLATAFGVPAEKLANLGTNAVLTPAMRDHITWLARDIEPGLIVSVGRLSPEKGFDTLIEAFSLLRWTRRARLVIVGEGDERTRLEALIAARGLSADVTLAGHQSDPLQIVSRAALYVCASLHEGLGNAVIEALACGVPVVSTDAPHGPREILENGRLGTLVPVGDAPALAAAMGAALDAPADSAALQTRAAHFTVEAAGARFLDFLDRLDPKLRPLAGDTRSAVTDRHNLTTA